METPDASLENSGIEAYPPRSVNTSGSPPTVSGTVSDGPVPHTPVSSLRCPLAVLVEQVSRAPGS